MQFTKRLREEVRRGNITCSVRIWTRPHVKPGGRYAMDGGAIEVESIEAIELSAITPALARESGFKSVVDLLKVAKHGNGRNVYLVRFRYISDSPAVKRRADSQRRADPKSSKASSRRKRVTGIIERLPEAVAISHGTHMSLEVRNKRFGWLLDDHHGDGRLALNCKASAELHDVLRQLTPHQFHVPKYLGNKGWIGLWLDVPGIDWPAVELALNAAYSRVAPKALQREIK